MKLLTKTGLIALLLFAFASVFNSCKKNDKISTVQDDGIEQIRQKYKNEPLRETQVLNIPGKGYYGDLQGNRITLIPGRNNASSCPAPGDSEFSQVFVSMEREFTCNVGYRFVVTYKITSEFYILNSISSTQFSGGRIRLKNSSGTYYYTTPSTSRAPLVTLQNNGVVGQNSNGDDLNEFILSFRTEYISETDFNTAVAIEPNLFAYTDCPDYATISIAFSSQQSAIGYQQNSLPCSRVDRVYWNPRMGSSTPPNLTGADPVGSSCYPWGYIFPHKQQVQFKNGSGTWKPFYLHINGLLNPGVETENINYWDVWYIDVSRSQSQNGLVPGNIQVRFRNNHTGSTSNGGPCYTEPSSGNGTWIYETWYIN